ncbi:MAG: VacJ family lipoprotein [bacterium]|nr:VacJ family lipoprotein [bacterium]
MVCLIWLPVAQALPSQPKHSSALELTQPYPAEPPEAASAPSLAVQLADFKGEAPVYALFERQENFIQLVQNDDQMDAGFSDGAPGDGFGGFESFEDEFATEAAPEEDWLDSYNRSMTTVNDRLYFWVLKPVATGWDWVMPDGVQNSINRFFKNIWYPIRLVNNLLQAEVVDAGEETARFVINSTVGLLGLFDPAYEWFGLEAHDEDFGQTLAVWGVGPGPHIVLPVLGPSNLRDALALAPDSFVDPVFCNDLVTCQDKRKYGYGYWVAEEINYASINLGAYESLKKDAFDLYPFLRDSYEQNRLKEIED